MSATAHKGLFAVGSGDLRAEGRSDKIVSKQAEYVKRILSTLGQLNGQQLSEPTHAERPWLDARGSCADGDCCSNVTTKKAIKDYYGSPECGNAAFTGLSL